MNTTLKIKNNYYLLGRSISVLLIFMCSNTFCHAATGSPYYNILWRSSSSGYQMIWKLYKGLHFGTESVVPRTPRVGRDIVDLEDLDGDGDNDIIWRDRKTGVVDGWIMNGEKIVSGLGTMSNMSLGWDLVDVEDLNGDKHGDLLWRNRNTGQMFFELLRNGKLTHGRSYVYPGNSGPSLGEWNFLDCEDLNSDGHADILWQRNDGLVHYWLMKSGKFVSSGNVYNRPQSLDWQFADVQDLEGDGDADIFWHNKKYGYVGFWKLELGVLQNAEFVSGITVPTTDWKIEKVVDLDGDGDADILWRHTDGLVHHWMLNNGIRQSGADVNRAAMSTDWKIVNAR